MNRQEFIDFLDSYAVMMELQDKKSKMWKIQSYGYDAEGLLRLSKGKPKRPVIWLIVSTKGFDAELSITSGLDFWKTQMNEDLFISLNEGIKINFPSLKKYKFNTNDVRVTPSEIFVKADYDIIKDIFFFAIDKIDTDIKIM